jgi:hypothetical protein
MSGRTCHIQVKNDSTPELRMGTIRAWLAATAVGGPPTFMFTKVDGIWKVSSPLDLRRWAEQHSSEPETADVQAFAAQRMLPPLQTVAPEKRKFRPVDPLRADALNEADLRGLLHIWTTYPSLSFHEYLDDVLGLIGTARAVWQPELERSALLACFGVWHHEGSDLASFESNITKYARELSAVLTNSGIWGNVDDDLLLIAETLIGDEFHEHISMKYGWSQVQRPSWFYTTALNHDQRLQDASTLYRHLVEVLEASTP